MIKALRLALNELMGHHDINPKSKDLIAFVVLTLEAISGTVDPTVVAWEKRGYWVKADKFRMEWVWAEINARNLREAIIANDWKEITIIREVLSDKTGSVVVSTRHRLKTPWMGAWLRMQDKN
jgi:hypothetical protein